jgi:hypothetical protein
LDRKKGMLLAPRRRISGTSGAKNPHGGPILRLAPRCSTVRLYTAAMEQFCRTCRFKGPAIVQVEKTAGAGSLVAAATAYSLCTAIRHMGTVRVGPHDVSTQADQAQLARAGGAGVADRTGHGASLCITDDFGCNRWLPAAA